MSELSIEQEWKRANRATGPKAYHHFSKFVHQSILAKQELPALLEIATGVIGQAVNFSDLSQPRGNPTSIRRKLNAIVIIRKQLSKAAEARDFEKAAELVARLWYHVLTTIPLIPRVEAQAFGQYALDDLVFVARWAGNGELPG